MEKRIKIDMVDISEDLDGKASVIVGGLSMYGHSEDLAEMLIAVISRKQPTEPQQ